MLTAPANPHLSRAPKFSEIYPTIDTGIEPVNSDMSDHPPNPEAAEPGSVSPR